MDLRTVLEQIDARTAQAFVEAARHVIDAMLIEAQHVQQAQAPANVDYNQASLSREGPAGGWLSDEELRRTTQQMAEAIAAEKWVDGALFAIKVMTMLGGLA